MTKLDNDSSSLAARPSAGNMTRAAAKPPTRYQPREDDFYVDFIKQVLTIHQDIRPHLVPRATLTHLAANTHHFT